jgi:hypothetical protein
VCRKIQTLQVRISTTATCLHCVSSDLRALHNFLYNKLLLSGVCEVTHKAYTTTSYRELLVSVVSQETHQAYTTTTSHNKLLVSSVCAATHKSYTTTSHNKLLVSFVSSNLQALHNNLYSKLLVSVLCAATHNSYKQQSPQQATYLHQDESSTVSIRPCSEA